MVWSHDRRARRSDVTRGVQEGSLSSCHSLGKAAKRSDCWPYAVVAAAGAAGALAPADPGVATRGVEQGVATQAAGPPPEGMGRAPRCVWKARGV